MASRVARAKTASLHHERHYYRAGYRLIVGIDEAGRGPLAGPVAAAAVALPLERKDLSRALRGVRDSKAMTAPQREQVCAAVKDVATIWGIGHSSANEIDSRGIVNATKAAMQRALNHALDGSDRTPDCLFLDYMPWPEGPDMHHLSIVDGDQHSLTIACASVLAKVWRDRYMLKLDAEYSEYGFARHKGYGTLAHLVALRRHGPCSAHRQSYRPVYEAAGGAGA